MKKKLFYFIVFILLANSSQATNIFKKKSNSSINTKKFFFGIYTGPVFGIGNIQSKSNNNMFFFNGENNNIKNFVSGEKITTIGAIAVGFKFFDTRFFYAEGQFLYDLSKYNYSSFIDIKDSNNTVIQNLTLDWLIELKTNFGFYIMDRFDIYGTVGYRYTQMSGASSSPSGGLFDTKEVENKNTLIGGFGLNFALNQAIKINTEVIFSGYDFQIYRTNLYNKLSRIDWRMGVLFTF